MAIDINLIKLSYGRCLVSGGKKKFFDRFYDLFLASHPQISEKFTSTDLAKQQEALQYAISMAILYAEKKDTIAGQILANVRRTHSPRYMDIRREHYVLWEQCLLQTIREYDAEFDDKVEQNWRELTQQIITYMLSS